MAKYKTYHGRKSRRWLKVLLLTLLVGGVVAFCVLVLPDYVTYSEDGLSINLPFFQTAKNSPSPSPDDRVVVLIPSPLPEPSPLPSPSPSPEPPGVRACFIPLDGLRDNLDSLGDRSVVGGFNAYALEYQSLDGSVIGDTELAEALALLSGKEVSAVIPFGAEAAPLIDTAFEAGFDRVILSGIEAAQAELLTDVSGSYPDLPVDVWLDGAPEELPDSLRDAFERVYIPSPADLPAEEPFIPVVAAGGEISGGFLLVEEPLP